EPALPPALPRRDRVGAAGRALRRRRRGRGGRRRLGRNRHGPAPGRSPALARARPRGTPLHPVRPRASGLSVEHLALAVRDQERSRRFYERYFGFGEGRAGWYDGGVLIIRNAAGFSLALGPTEEKPRLPPFFHFG